MRRAWSDVPSLRVRSPDCKETIQASGPERSHRRPRPDEDEQLAPGRLPPPARAEEQAEGSCVDERDQAKVDGQVAGLCRQRILDRWGVEKVELAGEDENRRFAPTPLESQRKVHVRLPGSGQFALESPSRPARSTSFGASGVEWFMSHHGHPSPVLMSYVEE